MTSLVWNKIEWLANQIEEKIEAYGILQPSHSTDYNWYNKIYTSERFRRAHIEIVDNRETHKIYILHTTIFPHFNDPSPIWGFDAICGPNKITGAFCDFSASGDKSHYMMNWFEEESSKIAWKKNRELPEWAKQIFSPAMIAAGNISDETELDSLCEIGLKGLEYYLNNVGLSQESGFDFHMAQNRYCYFQKQNPQVINSMVAMGKNKEVMEQFVSEILFPEVI